MRPQRIIAVSAVIFVDDLVLLIQRGHEPAQGLWSLPGGACEEGETLEHALIREVKEETNLDVSVVTETFHQDIQLSPEYIYDLHTFTVSVLSGNAVAGDDAADLKWVKLNELDSLPTTPRLAEIIHKSLSS
jgi:8-oxo-dGTP diphosphatase